MAFETHFFVNSVFKISRFPAFWMRPDSAAAVTLDADITLGMASGAGLNVSPGFRSVFCAPDEVLRIPAPQVRLYLERALREPVMAGVAKCLLIVATVTLLWIVLGLDGMDADKVAAMAPGFVVAPEVSGRKIGPIASALMAIEAPGLLMTLAAVIARPAGKNAMSANEVGIMVERYTFGLMTGRAFLKLHLRILFMRMLAVSRWNLFY
jgi:hypothetical protein